MDPFIMRMITMKYFISMLSFTLLFCQSAPAFDEREEAAVYKAYINNYYINAASGFMDSRFKNKPFKTIVISNYTSGYVVPFSYKAKIATMSPLPDEDIIHDFLNRNSGYYEKSQITENVLKTAGRFPIDQRLTFRLPCVWISDQEIERIFRNGEWEGFYRRYPNSRGLVYLSRVGFNKKMTQALLYFVQQYTNAAGEGYLVLLNKQNNEWKRTAQITVWIS
jgi:hypothetical protein